jgi:hypothetical protein
MSLCDPFQSDVRAFLSCFLKHDRLWCKRLLKGDVLGAPKGEGKAPPRVVRATA